MCPHQCPGPGGHTDSISDTISHDAIGLPGHLALVLLCWIYGANTFCEPLFLYMSAQSSASWNTGSHLSTVIHILILSPKLPHCHTPELGEASFLPSMLLHTHPRSLWELGTMCTQYPVHYQTIQCLQKIEIYNKMAFTFV